MGNGLNAKRSGTDKPDTQHRLAILVVGLSIGGITAASIFAIWLSVDTASRADTTRLVFTSVLPLFGTWVGTVLAFYFARVNLEAATTSLEAATTSTARLSGLLADPGTPVQQVMILKARILSYDVKVAKDADNLPLRTLYDRMKSGQRQRLPIFDESGAAVYVVHASTIDGYANSIKKDPESDAFTETVGDLIKVEEYRTAVHAFGAVGPGAVLAEARTVMRSVERCNDVFVTTRGNRTDPVLGWLTNTDLAALT